MVVAAPGYGKTYFGARWHMTRCVDNMGCKYSIIGAPTYDLLRDPIVPIFIETLEHAGFHQGRAFADFTVTLSPLQIKFRWKHTVVCKSFEQSSAKKVVSITASHAWVDECGLTAEQTPIELAKRVRDKLALILQKLWTGSPEGLKNWFARRGTDPSIKRVGQRGRNENLHVLHGTIYDNKDLPIEAILAMEREFAHDPNLSKAYLYGEFAPLYELAGYDFDKARDVEEHLADPRKPVILGWDFNVGLTVWEATQEHADDLWVVDENQGRARNTFEACQQFMVQFPPWMFADQEILVDGDASGHARSTTSYDTDYDIIRQTLKPHYPGLKIIARHANPSIGLRMATVNRLFHPEYYASLKISPRCTKLIQSLTVTTLDAFGKIEKPQGDTWTHPADGLGYAICNLRPIKKGRKVRGVSY